MDRARSSFCSSGKSASSFPTETPPPAFRRSMDGVSAARKGGASKRNRGAEGRDMKWRGGLGGRARGTRRRRLTAARGNTRAGAVMVGRRDSRARAHCEQIGPTTSNTQKMNSAGGRGWEKAFAYLSFGGDHKSTHPFAPRARLRGYTPAPTISPHRPHLDGNDVVYR